jgi:hypothetical protein
MAQQQLPALIDQTSATESFVHRTLIEFGLFDAFQGYSPWERIHCLQWIASSCDRPTAHEKISRLLDALDAEEPLYRLYKSA